MSGGQQQRVALARALANNRGVLLFDEPLSNVDAKVREVLRHELLVAQKRLGFTAIFVTHDQTEAMELATRIAVLDSGKVQQFAKPSEIYERPANEYVAKFVGSTNALIGSVTRDNNVFETLGGKVSPSNHIATQTDEVSVLWRPEKSRLNRASDMVKPGGLSLDVTVAAKSFMGSYVEYHLRTPGGPLRTWHLGEDNFEIGDTAHLTVQPDDLMIFDRSSSVG